MVYDGYHFWEMHVIWWFIWLLLIFWIFFTLYNIPGQRTKRGTALHVLQKRFASGLISQQEYE